MAFYVDHDKDFKTWHYLHKNNNDSIAVRRYYNFLYMNFEEKDGITLAIMDPVTKKWTTWRNFYGGFTQEQIMNAYDVHRSTLSNEIVLESDYVCSNCQKAKEEGISKPNKHPCPDCYFLNKDAAEIIGEITEKKGFIPHYYYSGSKSIHIHYYFNMEFFSKVDPLLMSQAKVFFRTAKLFLKAFFTYLREKMISCWDTNGLLFDKGFTKESHLVRAELSRNKFGFKTFLGYKAAELPETPPLRGEMNMLDAELGERKQSMFNEPNVLMEEFLDYCDKNLRKKKVRIKEASLLSYINAGKEEDLRSCVSFMLKSEEFVAAGDGYKRAMYVLANELKRFYGDDVAETILLQWNERMGSPVRPVDIKYRCSYPKTYTLTCEFIHSLLVELGFGDVANKCNGKVYK